MDLRRLLTYALLGAGPALSAYGAWLTWIVAYDVWPAGTEAQRLSILGEALLCTLAGIGLVLVAIAVGGPVGRISVKTKLGEAEMSDDKESAS